MSTPGEQAQLELTQLTEDLLAACGQLFTRAGAQLFAETLYDRGVRSQLFVAGVCGRCTAEGQGERIAVGKSPRGWPRCALCLYNDGHDDAMAGWHGEVGGHPKPEQMSEVPGHVQPLERTRMREFAGAEILVREDPDWGRASEIAKIRWDGVSAYVVLRPEVSLVQGRTSLGAADLRPFECPHCRQRFTALENGPDGKQRIPFHKVLFMTDTMECRGSRERVAPGVPNPMPDRPLPEGVQRVIRFVQLLDFGAGGAGNPDWRTRISDGNVGYREISTADLHAVLDEIPDVAPRYPTIWAYEQACRTIRERDARIEKALGILASAPIETQEQVGDLINAVVQALRLRMPRTLPATEEEKSDVARALEAAATENDADVGHWPTVARVLADEVRHLRTLGDAVAAEVPEPKSRSRSHGAQAASTGPARTTRTDAGSR